MRERNSVITDITDRTFEDAMARLASIVRRMGDGDLSLEESLDLFEEGSVLGKHCASLLDAAELRVHQLTTAADGAVTTIPLATHDPAF